MRLGIYGGSFDPVHYGHLLLAESCREALGLEQLWFVPAAVSPHKTHCAATPAEARYEMLQLALSGHASFRASRLEIDRGGVSYTVDTLREVRAAQADVELYVLAGADTWRDLPTWREPQEICRLASLVAVGRPGSDGIAANTLAAALSLSASEVRLLNVTMPQIELSSTDLRERVAAGRSICYRTPRAVEQYIATHGLYRAGD
ncbi:MAG: nicotinate-nucleotide adenylyltransferase [Planctomycetes bacterium]|nr:nicotinate-nucleotide adenylyltransferase [Planctomycetota bacterium]